MAERYRQHISPTGVQVGLSDSGGVDLARQLAGASKSLQNVAVGVGTHLRTEQGQQEGARDALAGKPKPKSGFASMTAYGQAYNSAAEAAYSAKIQTDIQTTLERLAIENEADPDKFQLAAQSFGAAIHDSVPEAYRPQVAQMLKGKTEIGVTRLFAQRKIREDNQKVADYFESTEPALQMALEGAIKLPGAEGDAYVTGFVTENRRRLEVMAREGLIQSTDVVKYDNGFREALEEGLNNAVVTQEVERLTDVARVDVEAASGLMEAVQNSDKFTPDQKAAVQKAFEAELSNLYSTRSRVNAEPRAALSDRLAAGDSSRDIEAEARRLYREGAYTVDEYESARAARVRNAKEGESKTADVNIVAEALANGERLNPGDAKVRKQVDTYFQTAMTAAGVKRGSREYFTTATELFAKTNVFPPSAKSDMEVGLMSPDPMDAAVAAGVYDNARKANPYAWAVYGENPNHASRARQIQQGVDARLTPESAVGLADRNINAPEGVRKLLQRDYVDRKVGRGNDQALIGLMIDAGDEFNPRGWAGRPDPPPELRSEFDRMTRTYFMLNGGNEDQARQQAADTVLPLYRLSTINGKPEIVKHGIPQAHNDIVRTEVNAVLDEVGYAGDKSKVRIAPSILTDQSVNGNLPGEWWVMVPVDDDGNVHDLVRGPDNRPAALIVPRPGSPQWKAAESKARQVAATEAEKGRERYLESAERMKQYQQAIPGVDY